MFGYLQKIGKALMFDLSSTAAIEMDWILDCTYWLGVNSPLAAFLIKAGAAYNNKIYAYYLLLVLLLDYLATKWSCCWLG